MISQIRYDFLLFHYFTQKQTPRFTDVIKLFTVIPSQDKDKCPGMFLF